MNMWTAPDDRKTSAVIRDTAAGMFAERGVAGVTIRDIAAAAGVSPALVIHHFGSKERLREAVDRHVAAFVEAMLAELAQLPAGGDETAFVRSLALQLDRQPALAGYVRRLLVDDGPAGDALFDRLFEVTVRAMDGLVAQGVVRPARYARVRAAFLLVNDLAVMLLRRQVTRALGADPFSMPGVGLWTAEVMDIYTHGMMAAGGEAT
jgi:AcrR family transcriptional regulator